MRFKPGDLVIVDPNTMSLSLTDGKWTHQTEPTVGVVLNFQNGSLSLREKGYMPVCMYEVLINGKIENRIETTLNSVK